METKRKYVIERAFILSCKDREVNEVKARKNPLQMFAVRFTDENPICTYLDLLKDNLEDLTDSAIINVLEF